MAISIPTQSEVEAIAIAYFQVAHRDPITGKSPSLGPRTYLGAEARALAQLICETLSAVKSSDDDAVPGTYTDSNGVTRTRNSTKSLDDWAFVLGLPSNSSGGYGRKLAQAAKGGIAVSTGAPGTIVTTGAQLTDPSGTIIVQLRTGFTMPGGGSTSIVIDAATPGDAGNLPIGTVLRWSSPPPGLGATAVISTALSDGFPIESDVALALRIVKHLQDPPKGGTASDIREWAEAAEDGSGALVGVTRAFVLKRRDGTGSATVVPTISGTGQGRDPGSIKAAQIQNWLDGLRIASDTIYVVRPRFVTGEELSISVSVHAQPDYDFDWSDAASATEVDSGSGTSIVVVADPPVSLTDAINNENKPRIAISLANNPIPFVTRVTAYNSGSKTLTLETELPTVPTGGEEVLPAGSVTTAVATAILAYVDGVGPSRQSGYADPLDPWEDSVSIGRITQVALSARDSVSGDIVCVWSPDVGNATGVTIAVGGGLPNGNDFPLFDNIPGMGPQLPECVAIAVRRA